MTSRSRQRLLRHPESTNEHDVRRHNRDLPTMPMPKVTELDADTYKITSERIKVRVMHLNLANYPYDLEANAKETGELGSPKTMYVLDKNARTSAAL